jgi:hypothetical protein
VQKSRDSQLPLDDFREISRASWDAAVASAASGSAASASIVWRGHQAICQALTPFMGSNRNHAFLPTGGGFDFLSVGPSAEPGCLEFMVADRFVHIMKPRSLTLERIASAGDSFLLLELDNLDPFSGVYGTDENEPDGDSDAEHAEQSSEELVEVAPAKYVNRDAWDQGFLDHDENGCEIPIPDDARAIVRWLRGKVLLVAKESLWNGVPGTYDGRHNGMTAAQIRTTIERSLAKMKG